MKELLKRFYCMLPQFQVFCSQVKRVGQKLPWDIRKTLQLYCDCVVIFLSLWRFIFKETIFIVVITLWCFIQFRFGLRCHPATVNEMPILRILFLQRSAFLTLVASSLRFACIGASTHCSSITHGITGEG